MPASTARLALPYPIPNDTVDVPRDVQALADKLDALTRMAPPLVSALPGSPSDGDECYLQTAAMAIAGVVWRLRYRAAISDSSKWEFVGGTPLGYQTANTTIFANGAGWKRFPAPLQVAIPVKGQYVVRGVAQFQVGGTAAGLSLGIGTDTNPTPINNMSVSAQSPTSAQSMVMSIAGIRNFDIANETYAEITVNLNTVTGVTPWYRSMELQPVRLG